MGLEANGAVLLEKVMTCFGTRHGWCIVHFKMARFLLGEFHLNGKETAARNQSQDTEGKEI